MCALVVGVAHRRNLEEALISLLQVRICKRHVGLTLKVGSGFQYGTQSVNCHSYTGLWMCTRRHVSYFWRHEPKRETYARLGKFRGECVISMNRTGRNAYLASRQVRTHGRVVVSEGNDVAKHVVPIQQDANAVTPPHFLDDACVVFLMHAGRTKEDERLQFGREALPRHVICFFYKLLPKKVQCESLTTVSLSLTPTRFSLPFLTSVSSSESWTTYHTRSSCPSQGCPSTREPCTSVRCPLPPATSSWRRRLRMWTRTPSPPLR